MKPQRTCIPASRVEQYRLIDFILSCSAPVLLLAAGGGSSVVRRSGLNDLPPTTPLQNRNQNGAAIAVRSFATKQLDMLM